MAPVDADRQALIDADVERIAKLARGLMTKVYAQADRDGDTNIRIDTLAILGVVTWEEEGSEIGKEDVIASFESRRHHVKVGILHDALSRLGHRGTQ